MAVLPYAERLLRRCPPWLQRTIGAPFIRGLGDTLDDVSERTGESIDARLPRAARPDALPYIGRDRKIVRGLNEADATYAARLSRWFIDHRRRGNAVALLRQLEAYYATAPHQIDVVYETGTRYRLDPTTLDAEGRGTITKDAIDWRQGSDPLKWSIAFIFVWYDSEPSILYAEAQSVIAIARDWIPAHISQFPIWGVFPDGDVWGYPEGELWGADDAETWGGPYAIDFYGVPADYYLTVDGGDYLTADGDRILVRA